MATHHIIVAGDMNDFNLSESLKLFKAATFVMLGVKAPKGLGLTYSGFGLHLRLDYILYNERLHLQQIEVSRSELSAHRPIIADFIIEGNK